MENNDFRDVVEPSKIKRMQELLDESYAKGFADGKEEGLRVARQDRLPMSAIEDIKAEIGKNIGDNLYKNDGLYLAMQIIDKHTM